MPLTRLGFTGGCRGATPSPNAFAPSVNFSIFPCLSVNSALLSYCSVSSELVLYPVAAFSVCSLVGRVEKSRLASSVMLSDWVSSSTRASKSSIGAFLQEACL